MIRRTASIATLLTLALFPFAGRAHAGILSDPSSAGFSPRVPISAFARPAAWFDPSRLHLVSTTSVGSGFGGQTSALQVTSLSYQFRAPVTMSVSVGNAFGLDQGRSGSPFFLEGLDLSWRPGKNALFRFEMHDVRSPLQYRAWGRGYGGVDPFTAPF